MKDVMGRLADARPAYLDGDGRPDESVRGYELGRVFAQPRGSASRRRRTRVLVPVAVTGMAAATALGLVIGLGGGGARRGPAAQVTLGGANALLAAADRVERAPMGTYWYSDTVAAQSFLTKEGYAISGALRERFTVTSVRGEGSNTYSDRILPARPLTARDEAAWRQAGSPRNLHVWAGDHWDDFSMTAVPGPGWTSKRSGARFSMSPVTSAAAADDWETVAQLQNLPTDQARLEARFFPPMKPLPPLTVDNVYTVDWQPEVHMVEQAGAMTAYPLPPKVRAGLLRALAAQPGVRGYGTVTDVLGRKGIAVGCDAPDREVWTKSAKSANEPASGAPGEPSQVGWKKAAFGSRVELIFDPVTGAYMGEERILTRPGGEYRWQKPGFVIDYTLMRRSGWTDREPSLPTTTPFK